MLELTAFLSGAFVMVLEMVGARVLAPHVGTSAIVWTSLIGVVLACLAAGSWAGGKLADRQLSKKGLSIALCGAGCGCAITAFFHNVIGSGVTGQIGNLYIATLITALAIFALPAFFFGMITPYIIRLKIANLSTSGTTVGRIYALSTTGSILGTFLGGFILISWCPSTIILWSLACSMIVLSLLNFYKKFIFRLILIVIFIFLAWQDVSYSAWIVQKTGVSQIESVYNIIRIFDGIDREKDNKAVRLMATDPGYTQSGMIIDEPDELYFDYTRFYALGEKIVPDAKKILMLGGGGYSVPKWLLSDKNNFKNKLSIWVVEIDPMMTDIAKKYFALPRNKNLNIIHQDARIFLNSQKNKYDLIFIDVFNSHYSIPFQMGTYEAVEKIKNALAPGGAVLVNIISAIEGEDGKLFRAIWGNFDALFDNVEVYCVGNPHQPEKVQNLMLLAYNDTSNKNFMTYRLNISPSIQEINQMSLNKYSGKIPRDTPPLKDDFAPVERYSLMLKK